MNPSHAGWTDVCMTGLGLSVQTRRNKRINKQTNYDPALLGQTDRSWSRPFRDFLSGDSCKITSQTKKKTGHFYCILISNEPAELVLNAL